MAAVLPTESKATPKQTMTSRLSKGSRLQKRLFGGGAGVGVCQRFQQPGDKYRPMGSRTSSDTRLRAKAWCRAKGNTLILSAHKSNPTYRAPRSTSPGPPFRIHALPSRPRRPADDMVPYFWASGGFRCGAAHMPLACQPLAAHVTPTFPSLPLVSGGVRDTRLVRHGSMSNMWAAHGRNVEACERRVNGM